MIQRGFKHEERVSHLNANTLNTYNDTCSIEGKDNKSVKSTKSLGDRLMRRAGRGVVEKQGRPLKEQKGKHSNSLANILELRTDSSPSFKKLTDRSRTNIRTSYFSIGKQQEESKGD